MSGIGDMEIEVDFEVAVDPPPPGIGYMEIGVDFEVS